MDIETELGIDLDEETTKDKNIPKLYTQKNAQNKDLLFFTKVESKLEHMVLKADLSNFDEFLKIPNYDVNKIIKAENGDHFITYDKDVDVGENSTVLSAIPHGFYSVGYSRNFGWYLEETDPSSGDKYLDIGGTLDDMHEVVNKFYTKEHIYRNMNLKHKMGCLFYGPPGNGKTMAIREMIKKYKEDAVVIFIDDGFPKGLIRNLKHFSHNYIFIFEELTQIITDSRELGNLLLFLDGEFSLDKQLVLATTNYPEHLPANLASRPGRFDKLMQIGDPSDKVRRKYLEELTGQEIDEEIITLTKKMSIAYLKEIVVSSRINEVPLKDAIKENKARIKKVESAFAEPVKAMGFL